MKIYDISVSLTTATPCWPGDTPFSLVEHHKGVVCVSDISMGLHAGTHVDVPYHFMPEGSRLDVYPLNRFVGKVRICEIASTTAINVDELKGKNLSQVDKVIFKTNNSSLWQCAGFQRDFIGLEPDAARYLVECGIKLVGADYLSIQAVTAPDNSVHNILLTNDVLILEGPNLTGIEEDDFMLFCCPLCILGAEASPVRATLIPLTEL